MNTFRILLFSVLAAVCAHSHALAQEGQPVGESGRVTMTVGRGAMLISVTGGSGKLMFQGMQYDFKVGGLGFGLLGVTKVEAEGEVYHLNQVEDFAGAYVQGSADWAAGGGEGVLWLKNSKGVLMRLRSKTKGVSLAIGGEGLVIRWAK
ncbi:MAG: hypothetical protein ACOZEN_14765 [Thermodesulfobacteriota bacterium]